MADRIAVMNDGRIDQLGGPSEIYDRPATPFVADFIGDMNHLEGTLARDGEKLVCDVDGARFGIGLVVQEAEVGRPRARSGYGPRSCTPARSRGARPATVQTAMVLGHDLQVVARLEGGAEVMARQPPGRRRGPRRARARGQGMALLGPGRRAAARPRRRRSPGGHAQPLDRWNCTPEPEGGEPMPEEPDELQHPGPRVGARPTSGADHPPPGARRRRRHRDGRLPGGVRRQDVERRRRRRAAAAAAARRRRSRRPRPTARSSRATCWSPTGSTTPTRPTTRATRRTTARRSRSRATAPTTSCWPSCGRAARSTTSSCRPATR